MSTKCPNCQTDNTSDSRFCKSCAAQLLPSEEISASKSYREFLKIKEKGEVDWMVEDARRRLSK